MTHVDLTVEERAALLRAARNEHRRCEAQIHDIKDMMKRGGNRYAVTLSVLEQECKLLGDAIRKFWNMPS